MYLCFGTIRCEVICGSQFLFGHALTVVFEMYSLISGSESEWEITHREFEKLTFSKKLTFFFANRRKLSCVGTRNKISIASGLITLWYVHGF